MPDELATQLGQPAPRARVRPIEVFILAFLVLLAFLLIVNGANESRMTRELVCIVLQQAAKAPGSTIVIPPAYCPPAS